MPGSGAAAFEVAGDVRNVSTVRANIGFVVAELGVWERAETVLRDALADGQRLGLAELEAVVQHNLGRVLAIRGDLAAGEQLERQAIESFVRQGEPGWKGWPALTWPRSSCWAGRSRRRRAARTRRWRCCRPPPVRG